MFEKWSSEKTILYPLPIISSNILSIICFINRTAFTMITAITYLKAKQVFKKHIIWATNTPEQQQAIISHGILNLFFSLLISKVILIGGNSNNIEVYKVTHSMLSSIPFLRVLTWLIYLRTVNKATFSEPLLTTKRNIEFPSPDIPSKSCFKKQQRG